jgi:hypothetical protein
MSKLRRPWGSMFVLAVVPTVALAAACGPPAAAGFQPSTGSGGSGGSGNGGNSGNSGSPGTTADAAPTADGLAPFDGGTCVDDAGIAPPGGPASGSFSGSGLNGAVCSGGALAYMQSTPAPDGGAPQISLYIDNVDTGSPGDRIRFADPADALAGEVHVDIGLGAASSGTYDDTQTCGSVVLIADLPVPSTVSCATDAAVSSDADCPPGCASTGSFSGPACAPIEPMTTYAATASSDCVGDTTTPAGSWTLTLTSVVPAPQNGGSDGTLYYQVHGNLSATLAGQAADAGSATVALVLSF